MNACPPAVVAEAAEAAPEGWFLALLLCVYYICARLSAYALFMAETEVVLRNRRVLQYTRLIKNLIRRGVGSVSRD